MASQDMVAGTGKFSTLQSLAVTLGERAEHTAMLALHREGVEPWSYAALARHVHKMAGGLIKAGIRPGERIVLLADNQPLWIVSCLAILTSGAVVVPLDVQFDAATLDHILRDCEPQFICTTQANQSRLEQRDTQSPSQMILLDAEYDDRRSWRHVSAQMPDASAPVEPNDPAVLFYTSGTTGPPKGVPLSHGNLVYQLNALIESHLVTEHDRLLLPLPLHHVYPFVMGMLAPLALGLPIILPQALTGKQMVRALHQGHVTVLIGVPRLYHALYAAIEAQARSHGRIAAAALHTVNTLCTAVRRQWGWRWGQILLRPLHRRFGPQLRLLASGGAALDTELAWQLEGLGWQIATGYGLTETAPLLTMNRPGSTKIGSVGRVIPGVELRIDHAAARDASAREETQPTKTSLTPGEILARGPNVFAGYHNLPEETDKVFTPDGWFRTGDLGAFDEEGYLYIFGRMSTLIVTPSGENVQPEDVEAAYSADPRIREVGILQDHEQLVAVIVPEPSACHERHASLDQAMRSAVDERSRAMPSYQRIGDYVVTREPLCRTRLGKIRRHLLRDRYEQLKAGQPSSEQDAAGRLSPHDLSADDRTLWHHPTAKRVWEWLANHYAGQQVTPETSLRLDLGVDSLEWLNLSLAISQQAGVDLTEDVINRIDTVRDLLREVSELPVDQDGTARASPLEQPEAVLDDRQKRWLVPRGPFMTALAWVCYVLNRFLMRGLFRLHVQGLDRLPDQATVVLVPNHASYLDPFALAASLSFRRLRQTYWGGWTGVAFGNPLSRFVSRLAQVIPIDAEQAAVSSLALGAAVLKRQQNLLWFPEGQRSASGELQPFRPGIGVLLHHFQVLAVPVYIHGTHAAMPPGALLPRLRQITLVIGESVRPHDLERQGEGAEPHERIVHALHNRVANLGRHFQREGAAAG